MANPKGKPNPFRSFLVDTEAEPKQVTEEATEVLPTAPPPPVPMESPAPERKRGGKTGKRSNPDYIQVGAYIPKAIDREVKRKLLDEDMDFSDLVTRLLQEWLSN